MFQLNLLLQTTLKVSTSLSSLYSTYYDAENCLCQGEKLNKDSECVTFHEQHSIGYGFPSLLLATRASADVSELVFKHEWRSHECLKTIPTHPLRHTWPEVVMGNHTRSSAVHGRSFHKGLTKRSIIFD